MPASDGDEVVMMMRWLPLIFVLGCHGDPAFPAARFANAPPVTVVDDRRDVPKPPNEHLALQERYAFEVFVARPLGRTLSLPTQHRARGVNAVDEVPDSTWFTNRGELTAAQVRTGPITVDSPEEYMPWTVQTTKFGGESSGFVIRDAHGVKYILKLDDKNFPEQLSGADVVGDRLVWATGYNVPEDRIVYFRRDDLVLPPGAALTNRFGKHEGKLTWKRVDDELAHTTRMPDGRYRALASRYLAGKPAGDPGGYGVRRDDPNDRIRHELRRDRRGLAAIYSWIDLVDVWPGNFLDMWVADRGDPHRHYLVHYSVDFDSSLSALGSSSYDIRRSYTYRFDWPTFAVSLFSFGFVHWSWEHRQISAPYRGVPAMFTATGFRPDKWHCDLPFLPFQTADRFDYFWGAKLVARFSREQIRAAVEAGRYSDPRATEYITNTLVARQHALVSYWYHQVNPLDDFAIASDRLCFTDLALAQGYATMRTRYVVTARDARGTPLARPLAFTPAAGGRSCVRIPALSPSADGYTVVEVTTERPDFRGSTHAHVARDPAGALRVVGIWRL